MVNAKRKGNKGELVNKKCIAQTMGIPEDEIRISNQAAAWGGNGNADIVIWKAENLHWESKHRKKFLWETDRKQMQDDTRLGHIPILIHLQAGKKDPRWSIPLREGQKIVNYEPWIHLPLKCMIDFCVSVLERSGWHVEPREKKR